jgi:GMP synthase (glutamine-hydrolysing)
VKPFLFLGTRAEDRAADGEYDAVLRFSGLDERDVRRVRLERDPLGPVDLDDWSGIILGGGPFNVSDPEDVKSPAQQRSEAELRALTAQVVAADSPFLGCCYGIGTLGSLPGGLVDRTYGEPIGAVSITLSEAGRADPLTGVLPERFDAFLGHKEAVRTLPTGAVLLASSATCPVQAFRIGTRVYATQFHPELDNEGLVTRIEVYRHYGYFEPAGAELLVASARAATVTEPTRLLRRFVELFAR